MGGRLRIALYMRLSKGDCAATDFSAEDEEDYTETAHTEIPRAIHGENAPGESGSIRMQRRLLQEFAAAHFSDYELLEFEDDGYSGTDFNRPGVTRLLEMVRRMEINCIIVKDFSRFSRDYIELGAYLQQIFPFMGVRFISVNDGYDSAEGSYAAGALDISFKNLLYDLYSKDLSVKVKSALAVRKERGQYISAHSPFGYRKTAVDRHMLLIAEDEAKVVRRIFALALQGCSSTDIAKLLNREGVKTPLQFKTEKGETGRKPKEGLYIWQSSTVCQILRNRVYVGDLVYGKTEKETVGGKNHLKPRGEWKIYAGHHEPIIDRQVFELLQEERGDVRQTEAEKEANTDAGGRKYENRSEMERHPLTGRLVCGCCGRNLCLRKMVKPCFVCPYRYVDFLENCVEKADALCLEQYVLSEMQLHILQMAGVENLRDKCRENMRKSREEWKRRLWQLRREEALLKKQKAEVYEACSADVRGFDGSPAMAQKGADREAVLRPKLAEIEKRILTNRLNIAEAEEKMKQEVKIESEAEIKQETEMKTETGTEREIEPEKKVERETTDIMDRLGLAELTGQNVSELIDRIVVYNDGKTEIHWTKWDRGRIFLQL